MVSIFLALITSGLGRHAAASESEMRGEGGGIIVEVVALARLPSVASDYWFRTRSSDEIMALQIRVTNTTDRSLTLNEHLDLDLIDSRGSAYDPELVVMDEDQLLASIDYGMFPDYAAMDSHGLRGEKAPKRRMEGRVAAGRIDRVALLVSDSAKCGGPEGRYDR